MNEKIKKAEYIKLCPQNVKSYDFLLSIFIAAINNFKYDFLTKPFPPMYIAEDETRDYKKLHNILKSIQPIISTIEDIGNEQFDFLNWLFLKRPFSLTLHGHDKMIEVIKSTESNIPNEGSLPNYIFEIKYCDPMENKFKEFKSSRDSFHAFHGSRLENIYSILHYGLAGHLNKNSLFGEGIYFSKELNVSLHYAPFGSAWQSSCLGDRLSCLLVCEVVDCEFVKRQVKDASQKGKNCVKDSVGGELPEKYFLVQNDDAILIRYILVYAARNKPTRRNSNWFSRNKFSLMIVFYAFLLFLIGYYNK